MSKKSLGKLGLGSVVTLSIILVVGLGLYCGYDVAAYADAMDPNSSVDPVSLSQMRLSGACLIVVWAIMAVLGMIGFGALSVKKK